MNKMKAWMVSTLLVLFFTLITFSFSARLIAKIRCDTKVFTFS